MPHLFPLLPLVLATTLVGGEPAWSAGDVIAPGDTVILRTAAVPEAAWTLVLDGSTGGLRCTADTLLTGTIRGRRCLNLWVDGCTTTLAGRWEGADAAQVKNCIALERGGRLRVAATARINQQVEGFINARVIEVVGDGSATVIDFDPAFVADHMGFPDLDAWRCDGFSVLFCRNTTMVTHATASLPSVHKRSGDGSHTHHGVISLDASTWEVRDERQVYDGMVSWRSDSVIRTEADLLLIGHYTEGSHCYFGNLARPEADRLRKTGPGALHLLGSQIYGPQAVLEVTEGLLALRTDPARLPAALAVAPDDQHDGPAVAVGAEGTLACLGVPVCDLRSLRVEGTLVLDTEVTVQSEAVFTAQARVRLPLAPATAARSHHARRGPGRLSANGPLTLAGTLVIDDPVAGSWPVFAGAPCTGSMEVALPAGFQGHLENGVLTITAAPATPVLPGDPGINR
jgi:hypothetical protein